MQLGYYNPFCSIDNECTTGSHVRNITQEYILYDSLEVNMLLIITAQTKFGFQGNSVSQPSFHTLFDSIAGRVNKVIQELQNENIPGISNRKILFEHTEQTFNVTFVRCGF